MHDCRLPLRGGRAPRKRSYLQIVLQCLLRKMTHVRQEGFVKSACNQSFAQVNCGGACKYQVMYILSVLGLEIINNRFLCSPKRLSLKEQFGQANFRAGRITTFFSRQLWGFRLNKSINGLRYFKKYNGKNNV